MLLQRLISVFALRSYCAAHRPRQKISPDVLMGVNNTTATCVICLEDKILETAYQPFGPHVVKRMHGSTETVCRSRP